MNRRLSIIAGIAFSLGLVCVALWLLRDDAPAHTTTATTPQQSEQEKKKRKEEARREKKEKKQRAPRVLFGEVTDKDGAPVAGASVVVGAVGGTAYSGAGSSTPASPVVVTGADGLFTLDDLGENVSVDFRADGFLDVHIDGHDLPKENEAFWSQALVREADGVRVHVVVDNADHTPIAGAEIVGAQPRPLGVTDDAGIALVVPGDHDDELLIGHGLHGVVAVSIGASTRSLEVMLPASAVLDGVVVDEDGAVVKNGVVKVRAQLETDDRFRDRRVSMMWRMQRKHGQLVVGDDGSFHADVVAGHSVLSALFTGHRPKDDIEVDAAAGKTTPVKIVLEKSPRIEGVIVDANDGAPVPRATLHLDGNRSPDAVADDEGRFVLSSLKPQASSVDVRKKGYRTLTLGGLDGLASRSDPLRVELQKGEGGADVVGIGVLVEGVEGGLKLIGIDDGPAKAAGLAAEDVIVAVDGEKLGDRRDANMARVRGSPDTSVRLTVRRGAKTFDVDVTRARIAVPPGMRHP